MTPSEADAAAGVKTTNQAAAAVVPNKQQQTIRISKRQQRRQRATSDKHAWPQHPKITNAARRNQAYLRAAGLGGGSKQQQPQNTAASDADPLLSSTPQQQNFGRLLGSADARVRHETVLQLGSYLKARCNSTGISELELLKLCKCLWYTLYMADRVPVQDELAQKLTRDLLFCFQGSVEQDEYAAAAYMELMQEQEFDDEEVTMEEVENTLLKQQDDADNDSGSYCSEEDEESKGDEESDEEESSSEVDVEEKQAVLLQEEDNDEEDEEEDLETVGHCRGAHLAALFVRIFFRTVLREWDAMDKYRIDKFYVAIRYMMNAVYRYMAQRHWNMGIVRLFNDGIYDEVLSQTPNGVRYHLIDLCLEELCKVSQSAAMPLTEATFLDVLEPFFAMAQSGAGGDDTVQTRVVENVFEKFLDEYSVFSEKNVVTTTGGKEEEDDEHVIFDQVHVGTISQFIFEIASDEGTTKDSYRKRLYNVHKKYARRIQKVGPEHDVQLEDDDDDDDDDDDKGEEGELRDSDQPVVTELLGGEEDRESSEDAEAPKVVEGKQVMKRNAEAMRKVTPIKCFEEKKETKQSFDASNETIDDAPQEEEITISIADQKAAKRALKKKQKKEELDRTVADRTTTTTTTTTTRQSKKKRKQQAAEAKREAQDAATARTTNNKRVKFHDTNKTRSWTASMKNLRTMETPILHTTPERSILLNKGKHPKTTAKAKKGARRKQASDYFKI